MPGTMIGKSQAHTVVTSGDKVAPGLPGVSRKRNSTNGTLQNRPARLFCQWFCHSILLVVTRLPRALFDRFPAVFVSGPKV